MSAPAFVYVIPARFEDILKIGFSRDPSDRIRSFSDALGEDSVAHSIVTAFRHSLDAFRAFDIAVDEYLPEGVAMRFEGAGPAR